MKQHFLALVGLLACLLTSCNNTDVADGISDSITRSAQSWMIDLRDYGKVHNMMMDFTQSYLIENHDNLMPESFPNRVNSIHTLLKNNMNTFLLNTSIQDLAEEMGDAMDAHISYYGTSEDEHFLDPIANLQFNGNTVEGTNLLDQAYNIGAISKDDKIILKKLAHIVSDDANSSLSNGSDELQTLLYDWGQKHKGNYSLLSKNDQMKGFISGVCIEIGIYSCNWWHTSYIPQDSDAPQRIAPWLGYLIGKDVRGAIKGSLKYAIKTTIKGQELTVKGVGGAALSGAGTSSLGGLIKILM